MLAEPSGEVRRWSFGACRTSGCVCCRWGRVKVDLAIGTEAGHVAVDVLLHVVTGVFDDELAAMLEKIGGHLGERCGGDGSLDGGIALRAGVPVAGIDSLSP